MLDLPAYRPGTHMHGTTDSCITATWTDGDTPFINCYDAQAAQAVYALLAEFAEETEAWVFSRPVPETGGGAHRAECRTAVMYFAQSAEPAALRNKKQ